MIWTKQDERCLRALLVDNEATLRERLKDCRARDLMAFYTWDALIAHYMKGYETELKAAMIARKIADEFDPTDERINRDQLQQHICDEVWPYVTDPYREELDKRAERGEEVGEEIHRYINLKSPWPEGFGCAVADPFEYEVNETRWEAVANVLGIPYERRPYEPPPKGRAVWEER